MQEAQSTKNPTPVTPDSFSGSNLTTPEIMPQQTTEQDAISWTASEFIAHTKSGGWYLLLALGAAIITALVYFVSRDLFTSIVVLIVSILFAAIAARQPRELPYAVNSQGVYIGEKFYPYHDFRSFSVLQEEGIESIWFMPLKRFMPGLTIYFSPQDAQNIFNVIGNYLPFEPRETDLLDKFMHRLRF